MQSVVEIQELCKLVRYHILTSTTHAGSGHPSSALSAVELITTLFFSDYFKQDVSQPRSLSNDKFILSKGHASPLLYALYRVAGALTDDDLMKLRDHNSRLEGHPSPLFPYSDVETGSLGQGLSIGLGMALGLKLKATGSKLQATRIPKVFVLMGDSEFSEGQIYEAMQLASHYKTNNLVGILDVNRLGQRGETMLGWNLQSYAKRIDSFGWHTVILEDGHDIEQVKKAFSFMSSDKPTMIIAKTIKGKGISLLENKEGWHGKPVPKAQLEETLKELGDVNKNLIGKITLPTASTSIVENTVTVSKTDLAISDTRFAIHDLVATRQAYGDALAELGKKDENIVVLDAEMSNSTFAITFKKSFPDRFFEMFIAEQNMVSVALGLSKIGYRPYVSTFGSFLARAFDQIRMSQYSYADLVFCGSHVGVSMGQDGSSQMGLEDVSMFRSILSSTILYPSDANSAMQQLKLLHEHGGIRYLRTTKAPLPVLYTDEEVQSMKIGGSKILHQSPQDKAVVFAAGITLHEALKAYEHLKNEDISIAVVDLYSIKPLDEEAIKKFSHLPIIVAEDHYPAGGIGEAVLTALAENGLRALSFGHLCVNKVPHSGSLEDNLRYSEIDASAIVKVVKNLNA